MKGKIDKYYTITSILMYNLTKSSFFNLYIHNSSSTLQKFFIKIKYIFFFCSLIDP